MIALKGFQQEKADSVIAVFRELADRLRALPEAGDRAAAISHDGCLLLKAPTGSGKTIIAGEVAQQVSATHKVVWFWYAPFRGLIEQTEGSLRAKFPGLRPRTLASDRKIGGTRAGDCWVTTWQTVATRSAEGRRARMDRENNPSVDTLVRRLREKGFLVGAIVDEAHHGFRAGTESMRFYTEVLRPDLTLLVTATPDDKDAESFRRAVGLARMGEVAVSRQEAVEAGLVKPGIRSIAFLAKPGHEAIVDYETTALREGVARHRQIKRALSDAGIDLTPLLLVQADSPKRGDTNAGIRSAREKLLKLGFQEDQIATYTADEPDANLATLAVNESKEVLLFKMAVALGFDAPRAWTLVSMRGVSDEDFGTQIVGRLMRVHTRCQGRKLPALLQNAYVFLADSSSQAGLQDAAEKINRLKSELASVSGYTMLVQVGDDAQLQVVRNGQTFLLPTPVQRPGLGEPEPDTDEAPEGSATQEAELALALLDTVDASRLGTTCRVSSGPSSVEAADAAGSTVSGGGREQAYVLKGEVPNRFRTERLRASTDGMEAAIAAHLPLDANNLLDGLRRAVEVVRIERGLFDEQRIAEENRERIQAVLDLRETEAKAEQQLFAISGVPDLKTLDRLLLDRVRQELRQLGRAEADNEAEVEATLAMILVQHPGILRDAHRRALSGFVEVVNAADLPPVLRAERRLEHSGRNVYGVMPETLNSWERPFAEWLDGEAGDQVLWWHRNPVRRPESVAICLPDGKPFFPDFVVGVRGRKKPDHILLIDTKFGINDTPNAKPKAVVAHRDYGRAMILYWEDRKRWMTVRYDPLRDLNDVDRKLHPGLLAHFD